MTDTIYCSLDTFKELGALLEERARLITGKKADKAKLMKARASLEMKVQSERCYNARIKRVNEQLAGLQGKTIEAAL